MTISDLIMMCVRNLFRRKMRTFLTVAGVVVGTCAIVVMISLGLGMQANTDAMLEQMGDLTVIEILNWNGATSEGVKLDDAALRQIAAFSHVEAVTPLYRAYDMNLYLRAGKNDRYQCYAWSVLGVYPEALEAFGYVSKEGRFLQEDDKTYTMMVGEYAAYGFQDTRKRPGFDMVWPYPDENGHMDDPYIDILHEKIKLVIEPTKEDAKAIELETAVVGTMMEDFSRGWETREGFFMNVADLKNLLLQAKKADGQKFSLDDINYEQAKVKVGDMKYVPDVEAQIQSMGYETYSMETIRKPLQDQARQQQMFLGGLGAISLLVAALGITNTMVMSIYERTREIGVMKVVGCLVGNIRTVFLMEAGCIGFLGGVSGVGISLGLSALMNHLSTSGAVSSGGLGTGFLGGFLGSGGGGMPISIIPLWLMGASVLFATMVGLVSGFAPANRAVKISALEAIKHD